ncbi:transposable element Tcb1 transposase [Trichonephila clavipes]|nr:transposable element Tcb1 transposase [Trichonephila clavipes]
MQEGTMDQHGRSHPPQCVTSREDRKIVRMAVTDRSVTSRTVEHHIESVTHHSVSARTIRRPLQQSGLSARSPLLGLPLTQCHRCLHRQSTHFRYFKQPKLHLRGVGDNCPSLTSGLGQSHISTVRNNARPHVTRIVQRFFVNHQIELHLWPVHSLDLSLIENIWSMVAQQLTQITPPAATPEQFWQRVEAAWSDVPREHIQSLFESMPRRVAAMVSNNGAYSGY